MLQVYGGNPNKGSLDKRPLVAVFLRQDVELVDMLLKHGADPNLASMSYRNSKYELPLLFFAVDKDNSDIIVLLLNAGARVNAVNHEGRSVVCFAVEKLTSSYYHQSTEKMRKKLSTIRLLLQYGADINMLMPDGHSPLYIVVTAMAEARIRGNRFRRYVELLQLLVKHGAMLRDSSSQLGDDICGQSLGSGSLKALATFDGEHEFIVDLFRAGAGFQLIAFCCNVVATSPWQAKSICLCQAAVLAGYSPSDEELQDLQLAAARENAADGVLEQLVNWLNEDRQQVPSLLRQCRVVVRRLLSVAVHYQTILPAIDELEVLNKVKQYLQFDGTISEVNLSVNNELQSPDTSQETSVESRHQLLSPYNSEHSSNYDFSDFKDNYTGHDDI